MVYWRLCECTCGQGSAPWYMHKKWCYEFYSEGK